jgi:hypothetical protein
MTGERWAERILGVQLSQAVPDGGVRPVARGARRAHRARSATNSCMTTSTSVFPNFPDGHDYNQLASIYAHAN